MHGKVVRILLDEGAEVDAQQGVLVVEAMKMQNEVSSPKAGRVAELRVREGQTVNAGEVLAVIDEGLPRKPI
jgi:biotin carboxyl carrier protein